MKRFVDEKSRFDDGAGIYNSIDVKCFKVDKLVLIPNVDE